MDKKEYIVNQLRRTFNKKYENYCITRIYHKLDRLDVQIITQQLFKRDNGKIALADLYFPQLNLYVEIDESHHLNQAEDDKHRTDEIAKYDKLIRTKIKNLEEIIIDPIQEIRVSANYMDSIEDINNRINEVVKIISNKINEMGDKFIPWNIINNPAEYFKSMGNISIHDSVRFRTIDDIGNMFNVEVPFYKRIHAFFNIKNNIYVWCPNLKLNGDECKNIKCDNELDGYYIYESSKNNNDNFVKEVINKDEIRYVFAKYKNEIGIKNYKFMGVYKLDEERTLEINKRAWKRIADSIKLKEI